MNRTSIRFCPGCGKATIEWKAVNNFVCSSCGFTLYLNTAAAVAVVIECRGKILFAVRAADPGKGMLDLPGGFIDPGETFEAGVARELKEELGIEVGKFEYLFSFPNTYPYRNIVYHTCDLFVRVSYDDFPAVKAQDDISEAIWLGRDEIELDKIAFDSIRRGVERVLG